MDNAGASLVAALLAVSAVIFAIRWRAADDASAVHAAWFVSFIAAVSVTTTGPLHQLAEERLAIAHVIVLILLLNAAPLLLMRALTAQLLGARLSVVARWNAVGHFAIPIIVLTMTVYVWHVPTVFDAAADDPLLAAGQHLSFLGAGLLVWWPIAAPEAVRPTMRGLTPFFYMAADEILVGALGIVLTWAPNPLFETYAEAPRSWGLSAATDQSVAGAILLLVEEMPLAIALVVLFIRMLIDDERELQDHERGELR